MESSAEPVASKPEKKPGGLAQFLAKLITLVILCALVPVVAHLLLNLAVWSWQLIG